jgi:type IV secretory pathway VirB9-like protein
LPPAIAYDAAAFVPAKVAPEPPKPVVIVEVPKPLPLPGQLLPPPTVRAGAVSPRSRIDAANRAATQEPTTAGYINAVQVYPWTERSALPAVHRAGAGQRHRARTG